MKTEEEVSEKKESPSDCNPPTVATGPAGHRAERLLKIFNPLPLDDAADNSAKHNGGNPVKREKIMPSDEAARKPLAAGDSGDDEVDGSEGAERKDSVKTQDIESVAGVTELGPAHRSHGVEREGKEAEDYEKNDPR